MHPDGEALIAYSSSQVQGEETSFEEWEDNDPLPPYQDRVTGYILKSPPLIKLRLPAARKYTGNNHSTHHFFEVSREGSFSLGQDDHKDRKKAIRSKCITTIWG
jgi:hypothetical protein